MTVLAVNGNPYFEVSRIEIERLGYSYTVDTLEQFYRKYGNDVKLFFISGADAVLDILTWKDVDKVLSYVLLWATRPGYPWTSLIKSYRKLKNYTAGRFLHGSY